MKTFHVLLLLASLFTYSCMSYPEYTKGTDELGYSYSKKLKRYSNLEKALKNPEQVQFLDIPFHSSDQVFQELDKHIEKFTNLKKLTMYGNPEQVNYFPKNIFKCSKLEFLAISGFRHVKPQELNSLNKLDHLVFLALSACALQEIPQPVYDLKNLEGLDLTGNRIRAIPPEIANLFKLKTIDLTNNSFMEFPSNLQACKQLKYIDMNNAEGTNETALAEVGFGVNKLEKIEGLEHFKSLEQINVIQLITVNHANELKAKYPNIKIK